MAKTTAASKLLQGMKRRAKGAWKRSRETEVKARGGGGLPGGIENGVAKLIGWKLDNTKKGDPYVSLTGKVLEPEEHEGRKATISHFIKATEQKTVEDKLNELSSDIQLLIGDDDPKLMRRFQSADLDDLPAIIQELVDSERIFLFNTWKPDPDRMAMVFIQGLHEDQEMDLEEDEDEEDYEEEDDTEEDDEEEGDDDEEWEPDDEEDDEEGDEDDEDDEDGDEEAEAEEDDWEPQKGEIYLYKASPRGKPAECEVTSVNTRKQTVSLKRCRDNKIFKLIDWDRLEGEEE